MQVLIIKIGAIGDAVMALPLARELKRKGARITWLAGRDIVSLLSLAPEISQVVTIDERALFAPSKIDAIREVLRTWWQLRSVTVDAIYVLHSDPRYRLLAPPWTRKKIRTVRVSTRRHHTFDYARLAYPEVEDRDLSFDPYTLQSTAPRENRICIFPGGAKNAMRDNPLRRWPLEHYVELCELLLAKGLRVSIVGGPSDTWIEPAFNSLRARLDWQVGTMKLNQTVEFMQKSALAISHDTGPVHLASLADCPIVTIFGPTNSEWFAPLKYQHLVIERTPKLPCQPCYDGKDFGFCRKNICISGISPEVVAARALLALGLK